jgi:hypothetical protein
MSSRARQYVLLFAGIVSGCLWSVSGAQASQAATSDITDFITRLGGWFLATDPSGPAQNTHFWAQISYTLQSSASTSKTTGAGSPASNQGAATTTPNTGSTPSGTGSPTSGTNITTLVMTKSMMEAEKLTGGITTTINQVSSLGPACSNGMTTMDTITLDLRELQSTTVKPVTETIDEGRGASNPKIDVWNVSLKMNGGKNIIRVNTVESPPTCKVTTLPNGQAIDSKVTQEDKSEYAIEFADEGQARYLQMLIESVVPTLNPPRPGVAPLGF